MFWHKRVVAFHPVVSLFPRMMMETGKWRGVNYFTRDISPLPIQQTIGLVMNRTINLYFQEKGV